MQALLDSLPVGQLSAGAFVALIILMLLRGQLVTRRQHEDVMADRDSYRASADASQRAVLELGMAVQQLTAQGEATLHALTEIQDALTEPRSVK